MSEKVLYQHGTLGALMAGLMDGTETIGQVLQHGTLGLGTLHGLDGEVISWMEKPIKVVLMAQSYD